MKLSRIQIALATVMMGAEAHAAKIPQLDPTWMASQLFWLFVTFGTLIVLVKAQIHPTVKRVLDARDHAIQSALNEAEAFKASAQAAKSSFESVGSDTRAEASALIAKTQEAVNQKIADEQAKIDAVLNTKLADAEKSAKAATTKALASVAAPAAGLVQTMAGKLLGKDVTASDAESAIKKVA